MREGERVGVRRERRQMEQSDGFNSLKAPLEERERREGRLAKERQIPEKQRENRSVEPGVHLFY